MKQTSESLQLSTEAKVMVPDWGYKVDSGIGLSYRHAKLHRLAGRYDNRSQLYPPRQGLGMWLQKGTKKRRREGVKVEIDYNTRELMHSEEEDGK